MKTGIFLSFIFLCASGRAQQKDSAAKASEIVAIEQSLVNALPEGNKAVWERYLDSNCIFITEDGSVQTKQALVESVHVFPKGYSGYIIIARPHFTFSGNIAVFNYIADEHETIFGQTLHTTYATANTYCYANNQWRILCGQTFEIPQLPPAVAVPVSVLQSYTGRYEMTPGSVYTISLSGDTLYGEKTGKKKHLLLAETANVFFTPADTRGRKLFVKDSNGLLYIRERRNGQDLVWKKIK